MHNYFLPDILLKYEILQKIDDNIHIILLFNNPINPLSNQGIKIDNKIYRLILFSKSPSNISYEFEKGVILKFYFKYQQTIIRIINPKMKIDIAKKWNIEYIKNSIPPSWNTLSYELDYINVLAYENLK